MSAVLRIVTANIKAYPAMRPAYVRADLAAIADKLDPDLLLTQEMWFPRYRTMLRRVFPLRHFGHAAPRGMAGTCVTWSNARFRRLESGAQLLHGAVPGVCAWRRIVWAGLDDLETGARVAAASVHPTPSAFSDRFKGKRKARVRRAWDQGMDRLLEWIEDMLGDGYTHIAIGIDANANGEQLRAALGTQVRGKRVHYRSNGIDHVLMVGDWFQHGTGRGKAHHSDHAPFVVAAQPLEPVKGRL